MKKGKKYLKNIFSEGALPSESNFSVLIDSMFNLKDDEIDELLDGPLKLYVSDNEKHDDDTKNTLLAFYDDVAEKAKQGSWFIQLQNSEDHEGGKNLVIKSRLDEKSVVVFEPNGKIVFDSPNLEVKGDVRFRGLKGSFGAEKEAPKADSGWQPLIIGVEPPAMFSIVAGIGQDRNSGYAMVYAIASIVPTTRKKGWWQMTPKNARIHVLQSYSGGLRSKIDFRWLENADNKKLYDLNVRTRKNHGSDTRIKCNVTELW